MHESKPHHARCRMCATEPRWRALLTRPEMLRLGPVLDRDPDLHVDLLSLMSSMAPGARRQFVAAFWPRAAPLARPVQAILPALHDCGLRAPPGPEQERSA